jgi:hypothetical protein
MGGPKKSGIKIVLPSQKKTELGNRNWVGKKKGPEEKKNID